MSGFFSSSVYFPKKSFFLPFKRIPETALELGPGFTLVIIINNICVSKYAYAAVTNFKWDAENMIYFIYRYVMLPNKLAND